MPLLLLLLLLLLLASAAGASSAAAASAAAAAAAAAALLFVGPARCFIVFANSYVEAIWWWMLYRTLKKVTCTNMRKNTYVVLESLAE